MNIAELILFWIFAITSVAFPPLLLVTIPWGISFSRRTRANAARGRAMHSQELANAAYTQYRSRMRAAR